MKSSKFKGLSTNAAISPELCCDNINQGLTDNLCRYLCFTELPWCIRLSQTALGLRALNCAVYYRLWAWSVVFWQHLEATIETRASWCCGEAVMAPRTLQCNVNKVVSIHSSAARSLSLLPSFIGRVFQPQPLFSRAFNPQLVSDTALVPRTS